MSPSRRAQPKEASSLPSGENATCMAGPRCAFSSARCLPVATSNRRTSPRLQPTATVLPSGEIAAAIAAAAGSCGGDGGGYGGGCRQLRRDRQGNHLPAGGRVPDADLLVGLVGPGRQQLASG